MANPEHLAKLRQGVEAWNKWRDENVDETPDLSQTNLKGYSLDDVNFSWTILRETNLQGTNLGGAILKGAILDNANIREGFLYEADLHEASLNESDLRESDLGWVNLQRAFLSKADLRGANLEKADLTGAYLDEADLRGANLYKTCLQEAKLLRTNLGGTRLYEANLTRADLFRANLNKTDLRGANLSEVSLEEAVLVETSLHDAKLYDCRIYGISTWNLYLENTKQSNLIITPYGEPVITVDNLEIAQFVYLLLHNAKIRDVIDTIGKKAVLILGRFTDERKVVLEAIREELRRRDYIPILFDFEKPASRDLTETISTLAHLSRFVIADLSDPNSIPHELMSFAEKLLSVPVKPIFCPTPQHPKPYPMLEHLQRYPHVLPTYFYDTGENLMAALPEQVIAPAEAKANEMRPLAL